MVFIRFIKMRRLIAGAFVLLLLAGCGGGSTGTSKTCTITQSGIEMATTYKGNNDIVDTMEVKWSIPSSSIQKDFTKMNDEEKKQYEKTLLTSLGFEKADGMDINIDVKKEELAVVVTIDSKKVDDKTKKSFDLDKKISELVKQQEEKKATCK